MRQKCQSCFNYMPVFTFSNAILLRSVGTTFLMMNAMCGENFLKQVANILSTTISFENFDFTIKKIFNVSFIFNKNCNNIRLIEQWENPTVASTLIYERNIIVKVKDAWSMIVTLSFMLITSWFKTTL